VESSLATPSHQTKTSVITGSLLFFTILDSKIWAGLGAKCPIESTGGSLYKGVIDWSSFALRQDIWKTG
jgi:hypothetical protein